MYQLCQPRPQRQPHQLLVAMSIALISFYGNRFRYGKALPRLVNAFGRAPNPALN